MSAVTTKSPASLSAVASTSADASTSAVLKRSCKRKKDEKAQFKKVIVKQCAEDLISPAKLAKMHSINAISVLHWLKNSGLELPTKYELHGKFNEKPSVNEPQPSTSDNQTSSLTNALIINPKSKWPSLPEASVTDNHVDLQTLPESVTFQGAFLCPKCDHKSPSQYHLDMHIEGHRDCSQCEMTFFGINGPRDFATHIKKHEIKEKKKKQFKCEFCNFEYKTKQTLNRHQSTCKKKK